MLSLHDFTTAFDIISKVAHKTPVLTSNTLNKITKANISLKCENFQKTGAFKFRGAYHAAKKLVKVRTVKGLVTHSAGNHGQGVALAGKLLGIKTIIVMPKDAPIVKKNAVRGYDAEIVECEQWEREDTTIKISKAKEFDLIHPYDNLDVICGAGTVAFELLNEKPQLDVILAPVSGGGLLSGTSLATKNIKPDIEIIGVEPENDDDAYRSFYQGELQPAVFDRRTIADGLRGVSLGKLTFKIIKENVDKIVTVSEEDILNAMKFLWERMKIIVEPSGATSLAPLLNGQLNVEGKNVGVILTGGNVNLEDYFIEQRKLIMKENDEKTKSEL
ncbi:MAG: threonine/serine dehydratase [Promethearchaeota archaeon]